MQGPASPIKINLGLSALPKDTSNMNSWSQDLNLQPFDYQFTAR